MNKPIKKRNPLAQELWSSKYIRTVENKRVYKRAIKHRHQTEGSCCLRELG
ncbi:MAG: hypothetical protein ACO4CS_12315 [bacterium]